MYGAERKSYQKKNYWMQPFLYLAYPTNNIGDPSSNYDQILESLKALLWALT